MDSQEHNLSLGFHNDTPWFSECTLDPDYDTRRIILFLLYLFIFTAGLLENLLVLWVNWRQRHSADGVLFCVLNMTFSDLIMVVTLPFFMMEVTIDKVWLWGRFLCKVTNFVCELNVKSSSIFLALMTLERYLSLAKPTFSVVGRRRWWLCGGVWLLSLFLTLLENLHVDLIEWDEPGCYMYPDHHLIVLFVSTGFLIFIFQFLGPTAVIITCNILISRAVHTAPDGENRRDVWLVHVYSLVFVVCWLPYHLVMVIWHIDALAYGSILSCDFQYMLAFSYELVKVLSLLHCVANPIFYNFLRGDFRHNLFDTVASYVNKEGANTLAGAEVEVEKQRRISDASTSQSDIGS